MFSRSTLAFMAMALLCAGPALGGLVTWDNYPGDVISAIHNTTSERNTSIIESTWSIDDVDWTQTEPAIDATDLRLTSLQWVGAREIGGSYSKIDVIILDTNLENEVVYSDLDYTAELYDPEPNPAPGIETFTGNVTFAEPLTVPSEHFYIGVRLVSDVNSQGRGFFVTHSIDESLQGQTGGFVRSAIFGAPDWTSAADLWYSWPNSPYNFEYAFRVDGYVVPEPASIALLLLGCVALSRRR